MYRNSAIDGISRHFNVCRPLCESSQVFRITLKFLCKNVFLLPSALTKGTFTLLFIVKEGILFHSCDLLPSGCFASKISKYLSWNSGSIIFTCLYLKSSNDLTLNTPVCCDCTDQHSHRPLLMPSLILCLATSCVFLSTIKLKDTAFLISVKPFQNVDSGQSPVTQHVSLHF